MALTATQQVQASEAARVTLAEVEAVAPSLSAEQETVIATELAKYEELKDKIKLELRGDVILSYRTLLEEVRQRIRKHFGWPSLSPEVSSVPAAPAYVGGISRSDKRTVDADADRVRPAFGGTLFR